MYPPCKLERDFRFYFKGDLGIGSFKQSTTEYFLVVFLFDVYLQLEKFLVSRFAWEKCLFFFFLELVMQKSHLVFGNQRCK